MPGDERPELLSDVLNYILATAELCLETNGRVVPEKVFHHHGPRRPPGDCCDALSIHVRQIRPSTTEPGSAQFPASFNRVATGCTQIQMAVDASLTLNRPCFPTLTGFKANPFPGESAMQTASDDLAIDARVLWCCLLAAQAAGTLLPPEPDLQDLCDVVWGPMDPFRGGACAGWEWKFTLNLPACCWTAPPLPASGS